MKAEFWIVLAFAVPFGIGTATLLAPTPASPPVRCYIEPGDPGCAPCTLWNSHLCRCQKIPACKV